MSDIVSRFKSNQNKGIIWSLLNEHNVFNGIDIKYVNMIKQDFDGKVNYISNSISNNDTMVSLNKKVISEMIIELNKYKTIQPIEINTTSNNSSNANAIASANSVPITSAEAQLQKQTLFQKNLETKQNEFDTLINKQKPVTIDFSDNNGQDKPNSAEMERKLAETIAWREKQLNIVLDTQNKNEVNNSEASISAASLSSASLSSASISSAASLSVASLSAASQWINRDNVSSNTNNILLKIDKNTPVDINVINLDNKFKKKVSFPDTKEPVLGSKDPEPIANNFLALLKKKDTPPPPDNSSYNVNNSYNLEEDIRVIKTQIKELIDNQNVILNFIKELHVKPSHIINSGDNIKQSDTINLGDTIKPVDNITPSIMTIPDIALEIAQ